MATSDFPQLDEDNSSRQREPIARTGANDHSWEREHRHPTAIQARAMGQRRREAEAKLEQHLHEARHRSRE